MIEGKCAKALSTELVPVRQAPARPAVEPSLAARLERVAQNCGAPRPHVIPGASTLIVPLQLPLKTDRKRRAAAPFAIEPYLSTPLDSVVVAVGPHMRDDVWLCAVADLSDHENCANSGAILPDTLAVPLPKDPAGWCLWFGERTAHLRTADGAALSVSVETFPAVWRSQGRPALELAYGIPPAGVQISRRLDPVPELHPTVLQLDLRRAPTFQRFKASRRAVGFAAVIALVTTLGHTALLYTDARALEHLAADRAERLRTQLADRDIALDLSLPSRLLTAEVVGSLGRGDTADPFMVLLSQVAAALGRASETRFRELRFDAETGQMNILLAAADLEALQIAEARLQAARLQVTAGATTRNAAGAERQLVIGALE